LAAAWENEIHALNQEAQVVLRVNTLKITSGTIENRLAEDNIATHIIKGYPDALILDERTNVFRNSAFKEGLFEVQDASSQLVALALRGGAWNARKSMPVQVQEASHFILLRLMQNKGKVLSDGCGGVETPAN